VRRRARIGPIQMSLLGIALLLVAVYFIFTKQVPFQHHYTVNAVVRNSNLLVHGSPVRISGVNVGEVTSVGRYQDTSLARVTMQIDDGGETIHQDATLRIRPRLFLEGNFYVDLSPGTSAAPALHDGGTLPAAQASEPVQLDQVLDTLGSDTRRTLQQTLQGFGRAVDTLPTAAQEAGLDPAARGLTGAQALNRTFRTSPQSLRDSAIVSGALTGPTGRQLATTIRGLARATSGLSRADRQLSGLVSDFDETLRATAAQSQSLRRSVALLGPTAIRAKAAFASLDRGLGPAERFADELTPGIRELPATITAADPWLAQVKPLVSGAELGGLLDELVPATSDLARLTHATEQFLPRIDAFDRCISNVILPTGNIVVDDGSVSTGVPNYQEFWYAMAGQAAEGQGVDGNGNLLRIGAAGGPFTIETGQTNYNGKSGTKFALAPLPPLRTRPAYPNSVPPLQRSAPCYKQPAPDVNGPAATGPADGSRPDAAPPPLPNDPTGKIG
jgi:phospholipid/cholesterol/gamma-HCH transport system substrate-binding protein